MLPSTLLHVHHGETLPLCEHTSAVLGPDPVTAPVPELQACTPAPALS